MTLRDCIVLDSFALLSFLKGERGADRVLQYLQRGNRGQALIYVNMINAGELFYITHRKQGELKAFEVWAYVKNLPLEIVQNDEALVLQAAMLKARYPLAYADAFAAATAIAKQATLVTGDPEFKPLASKLSIEWLR